MRIESDQARAACSGTTSLHRAAVRNRAVVHAAASAHSLRPAQSTAELVHVTIAAALVVATRCGPTHISASSRQ